MKILVLSCALIEDTPAVRLQAVSGLAQCLDDLLASEEKRATMELIDLPGDYKQYQIKVEGV